MLLKILCKIGDEKKTLLIRRDSINAIVPHGDVAHLYINNIGTPIETCVRFETLKSFLHPSTESVADDERE